MLAGQEGAVQGFFQPADLAAHAAAGQLGQHRVAFPGDDGLQHGPAGDPVDVGDHAGQLQVRVFEQFFHSLHLGGAGLGQVRR